MEGRKEQVSFVIPCYNSEKTLGTVIEEIKERMQNDSSQMEYEIILVNDCSRDDTFAVIKELSEKNDRITGIDLARNFGQHAALMAGFHYVKGDYVICLDDDGQMPIESVGDMLALLQKDTDVVQGKYAGAKQNILRRFGSWVNAKMNEWLLSKPKDLEMNSFWGAKRFIIDEIIRYEGAYPYIGGLVLRATRNIKNLEVKHRARMEGKSGYTFGKLLFLWVNGFTAFSEKPLRIASLCGVACAFAGLIFAFATVVRKLLNPNILVGYSSLIAIILFMGGMIMMMLGILGEYIGRMYICMNRSPQYVIREVINCGEEEKEQI